MSEKKFCWWVEIHPSQGGEDGWHSELIWSSHVPARKNSGEPGWANYIFEEPHPDVIVMVAPLGRTMTLREFNKLRHWELSQKFREEKFRYIKQSRLFEED